MSPRSAEFFEAAQRRLAAAREAIEKDPATALSTAYYAMLYAARAALSEHDAYAKAHKGTWHLFREKLVEHGEFDAGLVKRVEGIQVERERADYEAWAAPREEAERVLDLAAEFVTAVRNELLS